MRRAHGDVTGNLIRRILQVCRVLLAYELPSYIDVFPCGLHQWHRTLRVVDDSDIQPWSIV